MNDEVINRYLDLIKSRSPQTVFTFNTFFYKALCLGGYNRVHRWTKNIDIFSKTRLFIPIHQESEYHWCLVSVNFTKKRISYYDSFRKRNFECLDQILKYLLKEYEQRHHGKFDIDGWVLMNEKDCPLQINHYDSGIFVCVIAEHLARNGILNFSQKHMNQFRRQMIEELKSKKLQNPMP